jgi:hypothetical protein
MKTYRSREVINPLKLTKEEAVEIGNTFHREITLAINKAGKAGMPNCVIVDYLVAYVNGLASRDPAGLPNISTINTDTGETLVEHDPDSSPATH